MTNDPQQARLAYIARKVGGRFHPLAVYLVAREGRTRLGALRAVVSAYRKRRNF